MGRGCAPIRCHPTNRTSAGVDLVDARGGSRTHDLFLRREALYPAELRTQWGGMHPVALPAREP